MANLIFVILLLAISVAVFKFFYKRWILYKIQIAAPNVYPFFIEVFYPLFVLGTASPQERFEMLADYCWKFPDMMKLWLGPKLTIFVNSPERIQRVLMSQKCLEKWHLFYSLMDRDHGLIAGSLNQKWKEHRKFFNFSFNLKILESFLPTFAEYSEVWCDNLKKEVGRVEFDFFVYAKKFSFDVLCATSLGTDMVAYKLNPLYESIFSAFEKTEVAINHKATIPFLYPQTIYKFTKMFREERKAQKILDEFQRDVINQRRLLIAKQELRVKNNNNNDDEEETIPERNILIDHIILNEDKFTRDEIRDHVLTFVSGYETWANALAHATLLLAMHPQIQEKLFEEVKNASVDDLKSSVVINGFKYLEMVLKEIYRLLPTVPMILRETIEDFEIEPGLVIPKGINLVLNFFALHRSKEVWGENADEFIPDRFSLENSETRHPFAFLPFSSGSRICIAYKYSNISLKIAIIKLLQQFRFKTSMEMKDIKLKSYISLKLCSQHLLKVENRNL